jgi:fumarate reductase subunit C
MKAKQEARLYVLQRLTALIMAPLVMLHIYIMIVAVQDGVTTSEILARTRASLFWPILYAVFLAAAAVHGSIGFRNILHEMTALPASTISRLSAGLLILILASGAKTIWAIA